MRPFLAIMRVTLSFFALALVCPVSVVGQQTGKPLLSEEIRSALKRAGPEAAQLRFDEIFPDEKDQYEVDVNGLTVMATEYMKSGDQATAMVLLNMTATITRAMIATGTPYLPAATNPLPANRGAQAATTPPKAAPSPDPAPDRGPAREDLERFRGLYGMVRQDGQRRDLFVTTSCDGYLIVGPMWADVSNWWMKSVGDATFDMSDSFTSLHIEFQLGADGSATGVSHDVEGLPSPLPRVGPLPDGWGGCVQREEGR
jgi:hypothetical protein